MPFFLIGLILGIPIGAIGGLVGYFKLIAEAGQQGARRATYENRKREIEEEYNNLKRQIRGES